MSEEEYQRMRAVEDSNWWFAGKRLVVEALLRRGLPKGPATRILDVGCGTGATLAMLSRLGKPFGMDYSLAALRLTNSRGALPLCAGNAEHLPFASDCFEAAVALDILEHLDDPVSALREMGRVCRPGGLVVASVPAHPFLWSDHDVALAHRRRYTPRLLRQQIETAGLRVERITHAYAAFLLPALLVRRILRACHPHRRPRADLGLVSAPMNALLNAYMRVEAAILRGANLPFGTSLLCVARVAAR